MACEKLRKILSDRNEIFRISSLTLDEDSSAMDFGPDRSTRLAGHHAPKEGKKSIDCAYVCE